MSLGPHCRGGHRGGRHQEARPRPRVGPADSGTHQPGRKGSLLLVLVGTLVSSQEVIVECYFLYEGGQPTEIPPTLHRPFLQSTAPPSNSETPPPHTHSHAPTHARLHMLTCTHRKGRARSRVHDSLGCVQHSPWPDRPELWEGGCTGAAQPARLDSGPRGLVSTVLGHSAPGLWLLFPATPCCGAGTKTVSGRWEAGPEMRKVSPSNRLS